MHSLRPKFPMIFALLLVVLSVSSLLANVPRAAAQTPGSGGTLRIGWVGDIEGLNPLTAWSGWAAAVLLTIYEPLLWYGTDLKIVPWLATSYSVSPDGLSWTFNIVRNATWHDGIPFTSNDVRFTYEFMKNGNFPCQAYQCTAAADISSIDTPDNYTVVLHSDKPLSIMASIIATLPILPQHIWGNMNSTEAVNFANNPPIGTGPFKFLAWKAGEYAQVVVNPNYWGARPHIDAIIFKHYDSVDGVVLGLRSGEIDTVGISTLLASTVRQLEQDPNIKVVISPNLRWNYIGFNQNDTDKGVNPTLRDSRVRLALRYTVDKARYGNFSFLGFAAPGVSIIPPGMSYWYDNQLTNTYNLTLAAQILDAAGYKMGSDGIRVSTKGIKMVYNLYTYTSSEEIRIPQIWAQDVAPLGIKINVHIVDEGTLSSIVYGSHSHDIDWWVWESSTPDPDYLLSIFVTGNPGQSEDWSNATYDQLYQQQEQTIDPAARQQIIYQMQKIILQENPNIITSYPDLIQAYRLNTFTGYVQMVNGIAGGFLNIYSYFSVQKIGSSATTATASSSTPSSTTSSTPSAAASDNTWIAVVAIIIAIIGVAYGVTARRRVTAPK